MEITRILRDLAHRHALLVRVWGLHHDRWPLLDAAHSRWQSMRQPELDQLTAHQAAEVDGFYDALERLLLYARTTVDMPLHLDETLAVHLEVLREQGAQALAALDQQWADPRPEIDRDGASVVDSLFEQVLTQDRFGGRAAEE